MEAYIETPNVLREEVPAKDFQNDMKKFVSQPPRTEIPTEEHLP
jgi:hypothetical protein